MRARAVAFLFSVALLALGGCGDGIFTPARSGPTQLALRPYFTVTGSSTADVHRIRVTVSQLPGGEQVDQQVFEVSPAETEWNIPLEVPANSNLRLLIELLNATGTVLFSGVTDVTVTSGPQETPEEIPVFAGPPENLAITSVDITGNRGLIEGDQVRLNAVVVGGPVTPVVTWVSLNSNVATVGADGTVTAVGAGSAVITAFAGMQSDNVTIEVGARAARIDVTPAAPTVTSFGSDVAFTGRVLNTHNAEMPGFGITWSIADPTIATQMSPGVFRARRNGTTTITATATQNGREVTGTATLKVEQRPVTLSLNPATATLNAYGATVTLVAEGTDANGNDVEGLAFTWTSSDATVATVDNGVVTARANGTATIRASAAGAFAEAAITVQQTAATLTLTPDEATLHARNETVQIQAELTDAQGNVFTAPIVWTSSLPSVASVDANGLVTAHSDGQTVIGATAGGRRANATISVERQVASVIVDPASAEVEAGTSVQLRAIAADANGFAISGHAATWSSGDAEIASVNSNGLVSGLHEGETFISATINGVTGTADIEVTSGNVASVVVDPGSAEIVAGSTVQLTATAYDGHENELTDAVFTWSSSNSAVATVNSAGLVTGLQAGETTISATSGGVTGTSTITVTPLVSNPGGPLQKMLIVSNNGSDNYTFKDRLTPLLPGVTIDVTTSPGVMSHSALAQYDVIMLFENGLWGQSVAVGNQIAQYIQNGGNLVIGTFYWQDRSDNPYYNAAGWGLLETMDMFRAPPGMSSSEFYGLYEYRSASLDPTSIVAHPLTAGVTSLSISSYPNGMAAKPGTTVVASYENGAPLIGFVERNLGQRLVGIAAWPGNYAYNFSGDFMRIWTNALKWAAEGSNPVVPPTNVIGPSLQLEPARGRETTPKRGGSNGIR